MNEKQDTGMVPEVVEQDPYKMDLHKVRGAVKAAAADFRAATLGFSRLLRRVHDEHLFKRWQYNSFGDYSEKELGLDRKYAESLVRIERVVIGMAGIQREEVQVIGVAKSLVLASFASKGQITEGNRESIVDRAKSSSVREFKDYVRTLSDLGSSTPQEPGTIRLIFTPNKDQDATIKRAMEIAKRVIGDKENSSDLMAEICREYISRNDNPALPYLPLVTEAVAQDKDLQKKRRKRTRVCQPEVPMSDAAGSVCPAPLPQANPPVGAAEEREGAKRKRRVSSAGRKVRPRVWAGGNPLIAPLLDNSGAPE